MESLDQIRDDILRLVGDAQTADALAQVRVTALGRSGIVTELMKGPARARP